MKIRVHSQHFNTLIPHPPKELKNLGLLSVSLRKFHFTGCDMPQASGRPGRRPSHTPYRSRRSMTSRPAELCTVSSALPQTLPSARHKNSEIDHARLAILHLRLYGCPYINHIKMYYRQNRSVLHIYLHPDHTGKHMDTTSASNDDSYSS